MQITQAQAQSAQGAAETPITEQEAHAIGVNAYLYFYPLVTMGITRRVGTNVEAGKIPGFGPPNMFHSFTAFPAADFKSVVRPNFDTLYSSAFLDLTKEPVIVSAPDTNGRYYLLPMIDMWTDVFASPGWRTTGTQAGNFLITPPGWTGDTPSGMTTLRRLMCGLSGGQKRMDRRTTMQFTRYKQATKSRHSRKIIRRQQSRLTHR